jgi:beta-mannanase
LRTAFFVLALLSLFGGEVGNAAAQTVPRARPLALGAWIPGSWGQPAALDDFATLVGARPAVVLWYQDWGHGSASAFNAAALDGAVSRGAIPLLTWEPWDYTAGSDQPAYALSALARGRYDDFIRQWAAAAGHWGKTLYLRPMHEMNGNWSPWGAGVNGNTPAEYIAAWRHIVTIFRQEGARNVRWVWSPNVVAGGVASFDPFYPGDQWVDWVALDGYNWGTTQPWTQWQSLAETFGTSYRLLAALTSKPMLIAETASAELGGDKAAWISQGLLTDVPMLFPRVRAVLWFDENKETDWRVNSSAQALRAFQQVATSPVYRGRLPG